MHDKDDKKYELRWDEIGMARPQSVPIYAPDHTTAFKRAEQYFWDTFEHRAGEVIVSTGLMSPSGEFLGPVSIPSSAIGLMAVGRVDEAVELAQKGKLRYMGIEPR